MRSPLIRSTLCGALLLCLAGARIEAAHDEKGDLGAAHTAAMHELLEGKKGYREAWTATPTLVIMMTVMEYEGGDLMTGFKASNERLSNEERDSFAEDLTQALRDLTAN